MQAPFEGTKAYNLLMEYLDWHPTPACLSDETLNEFWRPFIDGNQQVASGIQFRMGKRFYADFEELLVKTKEELTHIPEIKPYLSQFLSQETFGDFLYRLQLNGVMPFEKREKGYLLGMLEGYLFLCEQQGQKITAKTLMMLHAKTMTGVKDTHCSSAQVGTFRTEDAYFVLSPGRHTDAGIEEYLAALQAGESAFEMMRTDKNRTQVKDRICYHEKEQGLVWRQIHREADPEKILEQFQNDMESHEKNPDGPQLAIDFLNKDRPLFQPKNIREELEHILNKNIEFELVKVDRNGSILKRYKFQERNKEESPVLLCISHSQSNEGAQIHVAVKGFLDTVDTGNNPDLLSLRSPKPPNAQALEARIQQEIDLYYQRMEEILRQFQNKNHILFHQLKETLRLIQTLCRIHPFTDGNTRTFVMLLLPFFLNELRLGKFCIFEDPNRFWLFSLEELMEELIQALINGQELAAGEESILSEYLDADRMFAAFSSEQQVYFESCFEHYHFIHSREKSASATSQHCSFFHEKSHASEESTKKRSHASEEEDVSWGQKRQRLGNNR